MHESLDEFEFRQICNRVTALIDVRIEFLFNILKTNTPIKTKFCKHIIIDKIYFGERTGLMVRRRTPDRDTRVRSSAGSVCCFLEQETFTPQKIVVFRKLATELRPLIDIKIWFLLNILRTN